MADLTYSYVSKLIKCDVHTGEMFWLDREPSLFGDDPKRCKMWNSRYAGKPVGSACKGYKQLSINKVMLSYHRVVWLLVYGDWPNGQIDHINGDGLDNRPSNLRVVTNLENGKNQKKPSTNTSGVRGVSWHKRTSRWQAQIYVSGKWVALGYYHDFSEAVRVRKAAESRYGFHANHGR